MFSRGPSKHFGCKKIKLLPPSQGCCEWEKVAGRWLALRFCFLFCFVILAHGKEGGMGQIKPPGSGPQVLVLISVCQASPF